jgi:ankyrin repeat protein
MKDLVNKNPAMVDGNTVLHYAAEKGHLNVVQELTKDLENKNPVATGHFGRTPLHEAAVKGHLEVTKFLCQNNPDISIVDSHDGSNALHLAAYFGRNLEVVKFLADRIPIDIENKNGYTACDRAKSQGHQSIVKYLTNLKPGLSPTATTATTNPIPSHHAHSGNTAMLQSFVRL